MYEDNGKVYTEASDQCTKCCYIHKCPLLFVLKMKLVVLTVPAIDVTDCSLYEERKLRLVTKEKQ